MELDFTADHDQLRDSARAFLETECPIAAVREIADARFAGRAVPSSSLHGQMVGLGWAALTVPTAADGLGLGPIELALVVEELGRALAPGPLLATISQFVPFVVELGTSQQIVTYLAPVASGAAAGTLAIAECTDCTDPGATTVIATPTGAGGYQLDGIKTAVFEPTADGSMIVVARTPGTVGDEGVGAFVVPVDATTVEPMDALDPSRVLATVTFAAVHVGAAAVLGRPGPDCAAGIRRATQTATLAVALDAVGAAQQLFDITLAYVKQREQFGVPIGSFQAIKHKFADMFIALERARALAYFAALTVAEDDDRRALATVMAKAAAGDAAVRIAKEGIQLHGGIGYTWESDVHLYVRRLESDALLFGTADHHRQTVADLIRV